MVVYSLYVCLVLGRNQSRPLWQIARKRYKLPELFYVAGTYPELASGRV